MNFDSVYYVAAFFSGSVTGIMAIRPPDFKAITSKSLLLFYCIGFCCLFLIVPITANMIAAGYISGAPWTVYCHDYLIWGSYMKWQYANPLLITAYIVITELWVLWLPSRLYIYYRSKSDENKANATIIRLLNLTTGLLFLTPGNLPFQIFGFIGYCSRHLTHWPFPPWR